MAYLFNNNLATIYRYILFNKDKEFVLLKEELEFVSHNFYLFRIRYEKAVNLDIEISDVKTENFLIPPISLQLLVENAIKHNEFTAENPLKIKLTMNGEYLKVYNNKRPKPYLVESTNIGLRNLSSRYMLLCNKNIVIENKESSFLVKLPLISNL